MSIVNVNARQLDNGAVFVQYQQDGKAKDAAFTSWELFVSWLETQIKEVTNVNFVSQVDR